MKTRNARHVKPTVGAALSYQTCWSRSLYVLTYLIRMDGANKHSVWKAGLFTFFSPLSLFCTTKKKSRVGVKKKGLGKETTSIHDLKSGKTTR